MIKRTSANQPWHIERNGINGVPDTEKTGCPMDLFWIWFAANIGILNVLYGGIIVSYQLSFLQSLLAAGIGSLSFVIVGILSIAGRDGSAPMLTLSRAVFGDRGNVLPTIVSWINLLGWESVSVIIGTLSLEALLQAVVGGKTSIFISVVSLVIFSGLVIAFGFLGQATLVLIQKIFSWVFGLLTFGVIVLLFKGVDWNELWIAPSGHWISGFLPAVSIIIAGTGISWGNVAADYSRYLPRTVKKSTIVQMVTSGSFIPVFILMMVGVVLTYRSPGFTTAENPIAAIENFLPKWMMIPYLIAAVGGMLAQANLGLYSSGLNLLTMGVRTARHKTIIIDAIVMISITMYVLFIHQDFLGSFESFMSLGGVGLASWEAVFLVDQWILRKKFEYPSYDFEHGDKGKIQWYQSFNGWALMCWFFGITVGLLFTNSPLFNGLLSKGIFKGSNMGVLFAFLMSGVLYSVILVTLRTHASLDHAKSTHL
ncbi:purine-cytosine permease family protein [Sulfoacidibacillus ferrooxidans]|uniref:Allantoin permease n=1 Tax=Sulfoacidibacillus ferrooxidans TaxID=2005001 RepID=A0A9X2AGB8_9BACL|nr:cytosine permease [Sulfoacidibacillus ferrooxidans]MCI0184901.1 hypothetical protein [Sulfoacidibacillus ferrooxidans]